MLMVGILSEFFIYVNCISAKIQTKLKTNYTIKNKLFIINIVIFRKSLKKN